MSENKKTPFMSVKDMAQCAIFVALISVGAKLQITIPLAFYPMHFTLQWLFVLLAAFILGKKKATTTLVVYLLLGLVGVPIFASGGGFYYLMKPTFGFLLGFLFAAFAMGIFTDKYGINKVKITILSSVVGLLIYYGVGAIYFYLMNNLVLNMPCGVWLVITNCVLSTIFEDFLLCLIAVFFAIKVKPLIARYL